MTFLPVSDRNKMIDSDHDILKIVVINRYQPSKPAIGFIKNIIAVGDDDDLLAKAINQLVKSKGGLSAVSNTESKHIALPIAGLMSDLSVVEIGNAYTEISSFVKYRGCTLHAPFMTLSFMALLVIPKIKISDLGMFDAEEFHFY